MELFDMPLFKEFKFALIFEDRDKYFLSKEDTKIFMEKFNYFDKTVKHYCVWCKDNESFTPNNIFKNHVTYQGGVRGVSISGEVAFCTQDKRIFISKAYKTNFIDGEIFTLKYTCNYNNLHQYIMYFEPKVENEILTITKIGQNIAPYLINLPDSRTYEKELDKYKCNDDYHRYFIHTIHGDNIAALLYLRRVFEKYVNFHLSEEEKKLLFDKKIALIKAKNALDPETQDLTGSVYGLLSKGIHELKDEECLELNNSLFIFIEDQLIFQESLRRKEERKESSRRNIISGTEKHK